jgi:hypothetical protein
MTLPCEVTVTNDSYIRNNKIFALSVTMETVCLEKFVSEPT